MEATGTSRWWWCCRCQAMVCGPAGFEGRVAVEGVAGDQPRYPALGDPVVVGDLRLAAAFDEYGGDDQAGFRHLWKSGRSAIPMS
jgi:hypothetical protein